MLNRAERIAQSAKCKVQSSLHFQRSLISDLNSAFLIQRSFGAAKRGLMGGANGAVFQFRIDSCGDRRAVAERRLRHAQIMGGLIDLRGEEMAQSVGCDACISETRGRGQRLEHALDSFGAQPQDLAA